MSAIGDFGKSVRLKVLPSVLLIYAVATMTTMAGMEISGWLNVLLVTIFVLAEWPVVWFSRPFLRAADWSLLALMLAVIASAIFAAPEGSDRFFISGTGRFVLLYLGIRIGLESLSEAQLIRSLKILAAVAGLVSVYAIIQHFVGIDLIRGARRPLTQVMTGGGLVFRSQGMWGHPVTFGHSMALTFCMCVGLSISFSSPRWSRVFALVASLAAISLIFSYTRGAWLGAAAAVVAMSFYIGRKVAIGVVLALIVGVTALTVFSPEFRDRFESIVSLTEQSNSERIDVWKANLAMFRDHPLLGVGYNVNEELITEYYSKLGIQQTFGGHAHNNYLQFLSGTGLFGFLSYTAFSVIFLVMAHRLLRRASLKPWERGVTLGALGAQVALHVGGLTECNFKDLEVNHQYMLILALLMVIWRAHHSQGSTRVALGT